MKRSHGEGTYYRTASGWRYRVLIDGRRVSGSGPTKAKAKDAALQRAKVLGDSTEDRHITLTDLEARWGALPPAEVGLRPTTFDNYRHLMGKRVLPTLGAKRVEKITARQVGTLFDTMQGSASTKRNTFAALVRVLDHAVDRGILARNVARDVKRPRAGQSSERTCTPDQARLILKAAKGHRYGVAAWLSYGCGLRRGEMLALRWSEVDLDGGRLTVSGNVTRSKTGGLSRGNPKTRRGQRTVPLGADVVDALREHRKAQAAERLAAPEWADPDLVLATHFGTMVEPRRLSRAFAEWAKAAGVDDTGTHLGRHFAATLMLSSGRASVADVAAVLGHDPSVLLNTYAAAVSEGQQAAADALGSVLSKVVE